MQLSRIEGKAIIIITDINKPVGKEIASKKQQLRDICKHFWVALFIGLPQKRWHLKRFCGMIELTAHTHVSWKIKMLLGFWYS